MTTSPDLLPAALSHSEALEASELGTTTDAIHRVMSWHGAGVYRYCRAALCDVPLADAVHHEVFVEACRNLARRPRGSTVRVWLFAIAHRRVVAAARRQRAGPLPGPPASLDDDDALLAGLAALSVDERAAVLLHHQQGFRFDEMAQICRERPSALEAHVARAMRQLTHIWTRL